MINTGVFVPGTSFPPENLQVLIGNQIPALKKGAYTDTQGVKQRTIIVENEDAKRNLIKVLTEEQSYDLPLPQSRQRTNPEYRQGMLAYGRQLTDRVITSEEYRQQQRAGGYSLNKLYIEAVSSGLGSESFFVPYEKMPPLKAAAITGAVTAGLTTVACSLAGCSSSTSLKVGAGLGSAAFVAKLVDQELKPDVEDRTVTCQQLARKLSIQGLQCRDIRILSYNSGDRSYPTDITSQEARQRARTTPQDKRALDEGLAHALSLTASARMFGRVHGYQGMCGFTTQGNHLSRNSLSQGHSMSIRQSLVRVATPVNPE